MRKQEDGYVLVLVLVTMAALAVLSLAAIQVNLVTNKLTVIRTEDTQLNEDAKSALQLISKNVRDTFPKHDQNAVPEYMKTDAAFNDLLTTVLASDEDFTLPGSTNDITYSVKLKKDQLNQTLATAPFTKVLQVDVTANRPERAEQPDLSVTYTQDLYLTALPSFLYYVLGSDSQLSLNGMPTIKGNIYSAGSFLLDRDANYQLNGTKLKLANSPQSRFVLDGRIDLDNPSQCAVCETANYFTQGTEVANELPDAGQTASRFSPFQYDYSIIEYLNRHLETDLPFTNTLNTTIFNSPYIATIGTSITDLTRQNIFKSERILDANGNVQLRLTPYLNAAVYNELNAPTIVKRPASLASGAMYLTESIAKSTTPLLFDGDVVIESLDALKIERPLIVNGNLTIRGNVSFDSTVFTLGNAFIDRANIRPIDAATGNSLILLAKGQILLNRINEFQSSTPSTSDTGTTYAPTELQAFLYSDSVEPTFVYAVGSILKINGGLYSKGPLEINVFRGKFSQAEGLTPKQYFDSNVPEHAHNASRLQMTYNDSVFNQLDTLPITNQLQFFVSQPVQTD